MMKFLLKFVRLRTIRSIAGWQNTLTLVRLWGLNFGAQFGSIRAQHCYHVGGNTRKLTS